MRAGFAAFLVLTTFAFGATQAHAQAWPNRPVRVVNTFAAGGAAEFVARTAADNLAKTFGQTFYVETRAGAGAGGQIGVQSVMATPPDGYNFVITNVSILTLAPITNPKLGYDPARDLTNIAYLAGSPLVLSVNARGPIKTLADFIAGGKTGGKPLTYSSSGVGSSGHLFGEWMGQKLGVPVEHVPYKGAAQGLMDVVGGHITFSLQTLASSSGQLRGGTLTPLAVASRERFPDFPDVPTFKELGYPEFVSTVWFSLSGPGGLPRDIVLKVNGDINKTMVRPDVEQRVRQEGMVADPMTPEELGKLVAEESARWKPVLERAGLIEK